MKIKDRLALYFTLISTLVLISVLVSVYLVFIRFMQAEFFSRLTDRTMVTAKLYLEADEISLDSLNRVRERYLEKLSGEVIRIYNAQNKPAFIEDAQQYWPKQTIERVRREKRVRFREGNAQVVGIYYKDNQGDFVILASAVDYGTIRRVEKLWKIMTVIFLVIFIGLLFSARWIAQRILRPLDDFIGQVKRIKSGNLSYRVEEGRNPDEITLLARNFNNLMAELEHAFVLQKTFMANASHELRTPVTGMIIGAELSLAQERSSEDYRKALQAMLEDAGRLEEIIASLLALAQADLEYGDPRQENLRLDELIWELQQEWAQKDPRCQLLVKMDNLPEEENLLTIACNPVLMKIALNNIIGNAFKFSDNQPVTILLNAKNSEISLSISDTGPGIAPGDLSHIFEPYYTVSSDPAHTGKGMGLYMANKIITLYGGHISVVPGETGKGVCFHLSFPHH